MSQQGDTLPRIATRNATQTWAKRLRLPSPIVALLLDRKSTRLNSSHT